MVIGCMCLVMLLFSEIFLKFSLIEITSLWSNMFAIFLNQNPKKHIIFLQYLISFLLLFEVILFVVTTSCNSIIWYYIEETSRQIWFFLTFEIIFKYYITCNNILCMDWSLLLLTQTGHREWPCRAGCPATLPSIAPIVRLSAVNGCYELWW